MSSLLPGSLAGRMTLVLVAGLPLVVVAGMLASFAWFFIYLSRRARLAGQLPVEGSQRSMLEGADPHERTAQC